MNQCAECGAVYSDPDDSCALRFEQLIALDHSRREPWGSRHGQAFAAFALQHPLTYAPSADAAWDSLYRIYCLGQLPAHVFGARRNRRAAATDHVPPRPSRPVAIASLTIADLGDFAAEAYAARLDSWCRAALAAWGASPRAVDHPATPGAGSSAARAK